jgi:ribonuclease HII
MLDTRTIRVSTDGYGQDVTTTVPRLRKAIKTRAPGLDIERDLWDAGVTWIAGVDEVGRGAWAGPLSVGAAVVPQDRRLYKVRDSKMLTEPEREAMFDRIAGWCVSWHVGHASERECDELGMSAAQKLATQRAIAGLSVAPDHVLVDGNWDFVETHSTTRIIRGDAKSLTISSASILAKVTRDRMMRAADPSFPGYNFAENKGYPGPRHKAALHAWGPTTIHRRSWVFMDSIPWTGVPRYIRPEPQGTLF